MEKQFEYDGHTYWIKVEPTIQNDATVYVAYVSDEKPGGLLYGQPVKDQYGKVQTYDSPNTAFTNANLVKQSQLGRK